MLTHRLSRFAGSAALLLLLLAVAQATATSNNVATSGADIIVQPMTVNDLVPPECAGMTLDYVAVLPAYGAWQTTWSNVLVIGTDYGDTFFSRAGENCVMGGGGNDTLSSTNTSGVTVLIGGAGNDQLNGSGVRDRLFGGAGNDTLTGGGGNDDLYGEDGNDSLTGGGGTDTCLGGAGNDNFSQCETAVQ